MLGTVVHFHYYMCLQELVVLTVGKDHSQYDSQFTHKLACMTRTEIHRLLTRIFATHNLHFIRGPSRYIIIQQTVVKYLDRIKLLYWLC